MTTPEPDPLEITDEMVAMFRGTVGASNVSTHPDAVLREYLEQAKADVDLRIGATIGIELVVVLSWYYRVAAELFDRDKAPATNIPDRFGGDAAVVQQRSPRSPLHVIEREVRMWVPTW
ncbi:hypothetical protein [Rhodococcus ruber]|uniref:hypothetical protein n=1 Tax=Rhodococcus ruber TaxID=1830 RepID=UPI003D813E27